MSIGSPRRKQIDQFLVDEIDSIPQLEALLLLWRERPRTCSHDEIAKSLYISAEMARDVVRHLIQHRLIGEQGPGSEYYAILLDTPEKESLIADLAEIYRHELVRVTNLIHGKASRAVRDFASAFRFRKYERK